MRTTELNKYKKLLLAQRDELSGAVNSMASEALKPNGGGRDVEDSADFGSDQFEQEFTLGLMENEQKVIREIDHALSKIEDGSFGVCEGSGEKIPKARLDAIPWCRYTVVYQEKLERGEIVLDDDDDN
ncbi:MAG: TraR/DksA C4-type zinc finger protein [Planctomycetota bacterium]